MNYNHIIKTETITENTRIESKEGFTSIEFFLTPKSANTVYINDQIPLSQGEWYKVINMPYVTIISDFKITSTGNFELIIIKHFYTSINAT